MTDPPTPRYPFSPEPVSVAAVCGEPALYPVRRIFCVRQPDAE